jgi:hypothetical protein
MDENEIAECDHLIRWADVHTHKAAVEATFATLQRLKEIYEDQSGRQGLMETPGFTSGHEAPPRDHNVPL